MSMFFFLWESFNLYLKLSRSLSHQAREDGDCGVVEFAHFIADAAAINENCLTELYLYIKYQQKTLDHRHKR